MLHLTEMKKSQQILVLNTNNKNPISSLGDGHMGRQARLPFCALIYVQCEKTLRKSVEYRVEGCNMFGLFTALCM
jgi:hypothetical protein